MGKKHAIVFLAAVAVLVLDQLTKFLIRANIQLNESIPIIKDIFYFTYVANTGSAFGLFKNLNWFFVLFAAVVIVVIFYYLRAEISEKEKNLQLAIGLLLGGTVGNLIDRLFYGAVIDFIDFRIWPVFNIADSAITISVVLLIILLWKK